MKEKDFASIVAMRLFDYDAAYDQLRRVAV